MDRLLFNLVMGFCMGLAVITALGVVSLIVGLARLVWSLA